MNYMLYHYNHEYVTGQSHDILEWRDERVTASFNKVNAESARKYRMIGSDV